MITNRLFSIVTAILTWTLGVSFYILSFSMTILENPEKQANIILALGIIPSACLATYLFYRKYEMKPSVLALIFAITAVALDALITVPLFVIPSGDSYSEFFSDPVFYIILVELYFIVFYFGKYLTQNTKK